MGISIFKNSAGLREQVDIQEAFNLWNMLRSRYHSAEAIKLLQNFTHDRDFSVLLNQYLKRWRKKEQEYEDKAQSLQIKVPARPAADFSIPIMINEITDDFIFRRVYNDLVAQLFALSTAYRSSTTNDSLRDIIRKDLMEHLDDFQLLYKYGKVKGWMDEPPAYKTSKPVMNEPLAVSESFHIWDHISNRYHQTQLTQYYLSFAHDKEFRLILSQGLNNLEKEAELLEQQANKYHVPLPTRPPASVSVPIDPETIEDNFMYASVLKGMQDAVDLHIRALVETIRNDSFRDLLKEFFENEITLYEKYLKYGKVKGWLQAPPTFIYQA